MSHHDACTSKTGNGNDRQKSRNGPVTFLVSALYQLFVRSCDLAHDGQHCSHFCANTHRSLLLHLSLVLAFVYLCSQMDEHQHVRPSTGTTELNHSYYAGNSLSALHSSQQFHDDTVSTLGHPLVSTQEIDDTTPSCSALGPQLPHGHIGSPVLAGPTRNVTVEAMPTSLAEAVTQLSETLPISSQRLVDGFMRSSFKKPVITFLTSLISSLRTLATRALAILLGEDTFEPDPAFFAFNEASTSKGTWCMVLLIVPNLFRHPSLSGTPTVTFCSVHTHNVVAKKRDASTDLLRRLHGYMHLHNVDFVGGDFNMNALSIVGHVFSDAEFSVAATSLTMLRLALDPRDQTAHLPVFLHLRTTNLPGPRSVIRSEQA